MEAQDFKTQLTRQLRFLRASCEAYDRGDVDEAVRIATIMRTLMKDRGRNTISLLTHLNAKAIKLRSSIPAVDESLLIFKLSQLTGTRYSAGSGGQAYPLGAAVLKEENDISVEEWCNQKVYIFSKDESLTRMEIFLVAAENDGGAHVDKSLPPKYSHVGQNLASFQTVANSDGTFSSSLTFGIGMNPSTSQGHKPILDYHYADIRQMATELLHSKELLSLIDE